MQVRIVLLPNLMHQYFHEQLLHNAVFYPQKITTKVIDEADDVLQLLGIKTNAFLVKHSVPGNHSNED